MNNYQLQIPTQEMINKVIKLRCEVVAMEQAEEKTSYLSRWPRPVNNYPTVENGPAPHLRMHFDPVNIGNYKIYSVPELEEKIVHDENINRIYRIDYVFDIAHNKWVNYSEWYFGTRHEGITLDDIFKLTTGEYVDTYIVQDFRAAEDSDYVVINADIARLTNGETAIIYITAPFSTCIKYPYSSKNKKYSVFYDVYQRIKDLEKSTRGQFGFKKSKARSNSRTRKARKNSPRSRKSRKSRRSPRSRRSR